MAITQEQIDDWTVAAARLPHLSGKCPVCHHSWSYQVRDSVVSGGQFAAERDKPPPAVLSRQIECDCDGDDTQRPVGILRGCGRHWSVRLTGRDDGSYAITPESDQTLITAAATLREYEATEETRVRTAAEKWLTAITALYGLFGLAGVVTNKDALAGFAWWSKLAVAVVFGAGVVFAILSVVRGYSAAYGWPTRFDVSDNSKLLELQEQRQTLAATAANNLKGAVTFAIAALGSLFLIMALLWFLPRTAASPTEIKLITTP